MNNRTSKLMKVKFASICFYFVIFLFMPLGSFSQSPKEIYLESVQKTDAENIEMISTLIIEDASKRQRIREVASSRKKFGSTQKMILKFLSPPDVRGTAMLVFDHPDRSDEMWIYMPALKKVRRIVSAEKGKSFMGSEFSNADMSKPNPDDYKYKLITSEQINGEDYFVLELTCIDSKISKELGYLRKEVWISKSSKLASKTIYYNKHNKAIKQQTIKDYKRVGDSKYFAQSFVMKNLKNRRTSYLKVNKLQSGSQLSENMFKPEKLAKQ